MAVTSPHKKSVLALRRTKTRALEGAGGGVLSAITRRIQDGPDGRGNSFPSAPRNLFPEGRLDGPDKAGIGRHDINRSINTMKMKPWITLGLLLASSAFAAAQEGSDKAPDRPQRKMPPGMIERFDKDGDGKLSDDEMKAMQAERNEARKEMVKKYDKDGDGKLSGEERKTMRVEMEAKHKALVEKYDANKNGKLEPEEFKAAKDAGEEIPIMGRRGQGGRGRGPGGPGEKGGPDGPPPAPAPTE